MRFVYFLFNLSDGKVELIKFNSVFSFILD